MDSVVSIIGHGGNEQESKSWFSGRVRVRGQLGVRGKEKSSPVESVGRRSRTTMKPSTARVAVSSGTTGVSRIT